MVRASEIKEILGKEFDVKERTGSPWIVQIGLRLSAVTELHIGLLDDSNPDMLIHERDRILIDMKREVNRLLWKYLGENNA